MNVRVEDVLIRKGITVDMDSSVKDATELMDQLSISCLVVMSKNVIKGILTTRDVISRVIARGSDPSQMTVGEVMTHPILAVREDTPLEETVKIMFQNKIKKLPIVIGEKDDLVLVGLLSLTDIVENHTEIFADLWEQMVMTVPADMEKGILVV
jgi:signal-transduction protein with cAMP-binding, CBS, and nucleotidyltransferase domain